MFQPPTVASFVKSAAKGNETRLKENIYKEKYIKKDGVGMYCWTLLSLSTAKKEGERMPRRAADDDGVIDEEFDDTTETFTEEEEEDDSLEQSETGDSGKADDIDGYYSTGED